MIRAPVPASITVAGRDFVIQVNITLTRWIHGHAYFSLPGMHQIMTSQSNKTGTPRRIIISIYRSLYSKSLLDLDSKALQQEVLSLSESGIRARIRMWPWQTTNNYLQEDLSFYYWILGMNQWLLFEWRSVVQFCNTHTLCPMAEWFNELAEIQNKSNTLVFLPPT